MARCIRKTLWGLVVIASIPPAHAFWRMSCSVIQTGRIDPIVSPGEVATHAHKISGASNFALEVTYDDLQASRCTSCEIQDDKSAYWTPQLYYEHANGTFEEVPSGGHTIYYLGRGDKRDQIEPFPPGFKMVSGDTTARAADATTMTYGSGRPQSERVSFACLDSSGPQPEHRHMARTDCDQGLRAQIHFPSCWDGRDYRPDNGHVAYLSQIDNGACPPTHPRPLPHLFFEVLYAVAAIDQSGGGRFVFSNGDATGYGFHGDFVNGWDEDVLASAVGRCLNNDTLDGVVAKCPPLAKSQTSAFENNCPEREPIVNEPVRGLLNKLPGCNSVSSGPRHTVAKRCLDRPAVNRVFSDTGAVKMVDPSVGDKLTASSIWAYAGCVSEPKRGRALTGYRFWWDNMTVDYCTSTCQDRGFSISGVEYGRECYCANALSNGASFRGHADCPPSSRMICRGNQTEWCGGSRLLDVWRATSLAAASTQPEQSIAAPRGCYIETHPRLLSENAYANATVTVDQCIAHCRAHGWPSAGLEYGGECYCGVLAQDARRADQGSCDMPCKGDQTQLCGGSARLSVWDIPPYFTPPASTQPRLT